MSVTKLAVTPTAAVEPITIGGFTLTATGLEVRGLPTFGEYQGVGAFIQRVHKCSGFWLADWIVYGDSRPEWREQIDAEMGVDKLTDQTVREYRYVATHVPASSRLDGISFAHHQEVAKLSPDDQQAWLAEAKQEGWTKRELRYAIKTQARSRIIEGRADTMHSIEVSVLLDIEGATPYAAEQAAWNAVKGAVAAMQMARVIAARARPR